MAPGPQPKSVGCLLWAGWGSHGHRFKETSVRCNATASSSALLRKRIMFSPLPASSQLLENQIILPFLFSIMYKDEFFYHFSWKKVCLTHSILIVSHKPAWSIWKDFTTFSTHRGFPRPPGNMYFTHWRAWLAPVIAYLKYLLSCNM